MKKYYAVAKGKTPGIYETWDDCREQVHGFPGAVYKGFPTREEAADYIAGHAKDEPADEHAVSTDAHLIAYVDGSYDAKKRRYAYGCVLVFADHVETLNGCGERECDVGMRNVAGEILGSEQAVRWAIAHGYRKITVYYDYEGIAKWANGDWKANKEGTMRYRDFIASSRKQIEIAFCKVAAHTGVTYNEMADALAKEAIGLK